MVEVPGWAKGAPVVLDLGDDPSGLVEQAAPIRRGVDEFRSDVARIGSAFEAARVPQFVHEIGACGEAQVGSFGEHGETDTVDADVAQIFGAGSGGAGCGVCRPASARSAKACGGGA